MHSPGWTSSSDDGRVAAMVLMSAIGILSGVCFIACITQGRLDQAIIFAVIAAILFAGCAWLAYKPMWLLRRILEDSKAKVPKPEYDSVELSDEELEESARLIDSALL